MFCSTLSNADFCPGVPMQAKTVAYSTPPRPSTRLVWMRAVRLFSFTASITPVLIGSAFAIVDRTFSPLLFPMVLVASVLCHAGCNLANDYFDYLKGTDAETLMGRGGVIQSGWLTKGQVRAGMMGAFAFATLLGIAILALSTWWLLFLAAPSLAAAVLYTGGSKPLGYMALGELTVWLFMGMGIVCGTYIAMAGHLTWEVVFGSLGLSALVAAILHANNLRDFETDRTAGKLTLAHVLGWRRAVIEFNLLVALSLLFTLAFIIIWPANWPISLVALTAPAALATARLANAKGDTVSLNLCVRKTAQLHFRFGLLMTGGLLLRAIIDRVG